ncbi:hypothetical protein [Pediococcus acidilactici]|uniref:hypothetical protein n=2 Tax=Pediococcus acidilactici TaxID=1254 RepID=UPI000235B244|nr:hypothetical protein [Pediococcus acidilactici]EHJ20667.1 hypothetical protein KIW_09430 [Pediococcus acidilactici MA18/5M]MCB5722715.1 hypothetical protein [Pediococcus acidilactici]MCB5729175.1 hypothetical protein [Pediococcus acidilactici]MCB5731133.1 hypothetical protein [Pediococcus acidilactici]MCB5773111.1 hypothetical protein [Pediococcus acidilactici]
MANQKKRLKKTKEMLFMDEKILKKSFWCFAFNKAKSQLVPLNQKLTIMPNSGIMVDFQLMLANYPTLVPLSLD